ncbi:MAG: AzlD domain-containing protein [Clostridia bacterium]|nr:AzlD domain-containing protein [Clostridia bacterium]MBQ2433778.1 AzlD domain-containing protein [Clostridia bacterium]MBQ5770365.1 AzlD domain-containing protein [Clostridia bacterium]
MDAKLYPILMVLVSALVTALLRFLPFWIFSGKRKTPGIILYLGRVLPYAIMGMLVVYCLKNMSFAESPFGIPEIVASAVVVLLHLYKRNTLLSICGGTIVYMVFVQMIF